MLVALPALYYLYIGRWAILFCPPCITYIIIVPKFSNSSTFVLDGGVSATFFPLKKSLTFPQKPFFATPALIASACSAFGAFGARYDGIKRCGYI